MINILEWHRCKFPLATPESQKLHLEEEILEFEKADDTHTLEELADIFIVAKSLQRWESTKDLSDNMLSFYFYNFNNEWRFQILQAVENKIKVINKRKYFWNGIDYDRKR